MPPAVGEVLDWMKKIVLNCLSSLSENNTHRSAIYDNKKRHLHFYIRRVTDT